MNFIGPAINSGVRMGLIVGNLVCHTSLVIAISGVVNEVARNLFKTSAVYDVFLAFRNRIPLQMRQWIPLLNLSTTLKAGVLSIVLLIALLWPLSKNDYSDPFLQKMNQKWGDSPQVVNQIYMITHPVIIGHSIYFMKFPKITDYYI